MLKRILTAVVASLLLTAGGATAQTCAGIPNTFTNGSNADANQVNTNFSYVLRCGLVETYSATAISGGVLTIDPSFATVFNVTINSNITTFTVINVTPGKAQSFTLFLTANGTGYTQAWGPSVKWAGGTAPTLTTTSGKKDILTFVTNDGGTTWYGFVGGQNF